MPDWTFILVAYLMGAFLMLVGLLAYLQAKEFRTGPVVAAAIGFIAGVAGYIMAGLVSLGGIR
jgi:ABC-type Mn2+/Zn2+ transport system permease subunit